MIYFYYRKVDLNPASLLRHGSFSKSGRPFSVGTCFSGALKEFQQETTILKGSPKQGTPIVRDAKTRQKLLLGVRFQHISLEATKVC